MARNLLNDRMFRYLFFENADKDFCTTWAQKFLQGCWPERWDPETDPIVDLKYRRTLGALGPETVNAPYKNPFEFTVVTDHTKYYGGILLKDEFEQFYNSDKDTLLGDIATSLTLRYEKMLEENQYDPNYPITATLFIENDLFEQNKIYYTLGYGTIDEETGAPSRLPYILLIVNLERIQREQREMKGTPEEDS